MVALNWKSKSDVRHWGLLQRQALANDVRELKQGRIESRLKGLVQQLEINLLAVYSPIRDEVIINWSSLNCPLAYPRVNQEDLIFYKTQEVTSFEKSSLGILEPAPTVDQKVDIKSIPAIVVPGVVFNNEGFRLGYGKGFYDRALNDYKGFKIGLAFSEQIVSGNMFTERHDQKMDYVVTDDFLLRQIVTN